MASTQNTTEVVVAVAVRVAGHRLLLLAGGGRLVPGGLAQRALGSVLRDARLPRADAAGAEQVIVAFGTAETHRVWRRLHARLERCQQLLLGPDQALPV